MDELQKIIAMIERQMYDYNLKADIGSTGEVFDEKIEDAKYQVCKEILSFVKSLQKESVNDDLEKVAEDYANKHSVLLGFDCDSEPIQTGTDIKNAVIYGARWHKQQMMKNIKEAHVIMTHITKESIVPSLSAVILDDSFKEGDKVKLVIMEKV